MSAACQKRGGYADWPCTLDRDHDGLHLDGLGRTFEATEYVPVIEADKITVRIAESVLDGHKDSGTVEIGGVEVAFYRDPFDKEVVWFFNPGEEPEDGDDECVIARFEVERTVVRA